MALTVPIPPELHPLMRLWVEHGFYHCTYFQDSTTTLFCTATGIPFTGGNFTRYYKQCAPRCCCRHGLSWCWC